ncbi:hypothetical protein BGY98DRAFT_245073 [Russula aff. rugulosa BPL654]|nr:hypothetical protein BGY98DRAFT_245073 [Russula aff. rugulosa BPL654]
MPQLETLEIAFSHPVPNRDVERQLMHTPITTQVTLPNLRRFLFQGVTAYLEALVRRITTPSLEKLEILFFEHLTFSVPLLLQFMHATENLRFGRGKFQFFNDHVEVKIYPRKEAKIHVFSAVEHLTLEHGVHSRSSKEHDEVDRTEWRKLLRSFRNAKSLHIADELSRGLQLDGGEPSLELLPELQELIFLGRGDRTVLNDGYISYTFRPQMAEFFLVQLLFKVGNSASIETIRDPNGSGAYFVFNHPSHYSPPPLTITGRGAWVLDYAVRSGGSVVPQELWFPQGPGDRRRYVDQAQFRMPVFFIGRDGSLGVPVINAAAGQIELRDIVLPPPLLDKTTAKIRIAWPDYHTSEQQVQLRDQTPAKNHIAFDRFVRHVGGRVRLFLGDCERVPVQQPFKWMVGHGNITPDEVMLIGIVQVSEGSWMPILQLMHRVVL